MLVRYSGKVQFSIFLIIDPMTLEGCHIIIGAWRNAWMSSQESYWQRMTRMPFFHVDWMQYDAFLLRF